MDVRTLGPLLVGAGALLVVLGLIAGAGGLSWFGKLPGDIRVVRENVRLYVPLTSTLLVSAVLSLVLALLRRLF
jgi:hypothetical protein